MKWANQNHSVEKVFLDPYQLPQNFSHSFEAGQPPALCHLARNYAKFVFLDKEEGRTLYKTIPIWEFHAIIARIVNDRDFKTVSLILSHSQKKYQIMLMTSRNLDALAHYWRIWAQLYNLPMVLQDEDGSLCHVREDELGQKLSESTENFLDTSAKSNKRSLGVMARLGYRKFVFSSL